MIRRIEILREAVKHLAPEIRDAHPDIPWRKIAGMRDKVIHDYVGVDVALVWAVASDLMPELRQQVQAILDHLASGGSA